VIKLDVVNDPTLKVVGLLFWGSKVKGQGGVSKFTFHTTTFA